MADFITNISSREPEFVIHGPSSLYYIANGSAQIDIPYKIAVPDILMNLIRSAREGNENHNQFLFNLIMEDHKDEEQLTHDVIVDHLFSYFRIIYEQNKLYEITVEDIDKTISQELSESFPDQGYEISLSPEQNFMRNFFIRALSWSRKTGAIIVESTINKFVALGKYIHSLQLPSKADAIIKEKQEFLNSIFNFNGGRALKWFIGVAIAIGGLPHVSIAALGVGVAFIDP